MQIFLQDVDKLGSGTGSTFDLCRHVVIEQGNVEHVVIIQELAGNA